MEKSEGAIAFGSVKLHRFLPSGRKLWTVVGKEGEYWVDDELCFCSCKDYYFTTLSGGAPCYHLKSVIKATEDEADVIEFLDDDYPGFIRALAAETDNILR